MDNYYLFLIPYTFVLVACAVYGVHRYHLLYLYFRSKRSAPKLKKLLPELPVITVQLPIFNEQYVVQRLIDSVCRLDYPKDKLEIQVLDDSTDETIQIALKRVQKYKDQGFDIQHIHRTDRVGFKAGALENGMKTAKGEFLAIFDADFVVGPDILKRSIHFFSDPKVGMVQSRWGHLNCNYSLLTRCQAIYLDGHFQIEHASRNRSGRFMSFNGTAGIWRREAITSAGGWQHDTLTEDLDLSYRSQMKGWKFVFLDDVVAPAELPVDMNAFKSQQYRWTKGAIQTAKKLLPKILKSDLPLKVKIEAFFHLTSSTVYLHMLLLSLMLFPILILTLPKDDLWASSLRMAWFDLPLFILATCSTSAFYIASQKEIWPDSWKKSIKMLPFLMAIGIGVSLNNARAVLEALIGYETPFVRTPKMGVEKTGENWTHKTYRGSKNFFAYIEIMLGIFFFYLFVRSLFKGQYIASPFILMFMYGYLYTGLMSVFQSRPARKPAETPQPAV